MRRLLCAVVLVGFVLGAVPGQASRADGAGGAGPRWQARDLGTLGGRWSRALDLDGRGDVVGWSRVAPTAKQYLVTVGFVWRDGRMRELAPRRGPTISTQALHVNARGVVLGDVLDLGEHEPLIPGIFTWSRRSYTSVDEGFATSIDAAGDVAGQRYVAAYEEGHAFVWRRGSSVSLGEVAGRQYSVATALNDTGLVVGSTYDVTASGSFAHARARAVVWRDAVGMDLGLLAGTNECEATGVNDRGWVIGTCDVGHRYSNNGMPDWQNGAPVGFIWRAGRMTRLPGPPADIAADGTVVGTHDAQAFLWHDGKTTRLPAVREGATSTAIAINGHGQVAGSSGGRVVVWQQARLYDLGPGSASAINDNAWIVGARNGHASLWTPVGA